MNSTVVKQCLWPNCVIKNDIETGLHCGQSLSFKACKTYITAILTHLVVKLCKSTNLRYSIKVAADAAVKG